MLLGSKERASSKALVARSTKPALRKSAPRLASACARSARVRSARASSPWWIWQGTLHLPGLALQMAQHLQHVHGVLVLAGDLAELADGQGELARGQVVEALGVVGRGAKAGTVAQAPVSRVGVGPAGHETRHRGHEDGQDRRVGQADLLRAASIRRPGSRGPSRRGPSGSPRRTRAGRPCPPPASRTMKASVRTSKTASRGAAVNPTSAMMGRSLRSSPM